jgi:hypothetical protein
MLLNPVALLAFPITSKYPTQAVVALDVEDLEVDSTPEDLMLSYVSGEKGKVILLIFLPCVHKSLHVLCHTAVDRAPFAALRSRREFRIVLCSWRRQRVQKLLQSCAQGPFLCNRTAQTGSR